MFKLFKNKNRYGLALGSGGFKGFVHIGVIKALEELGVEISHIGGSSIGSLVGGLYSLWGNIEKVEDIALGYDKTKLAGILKGDIALLKGLFKGDSFTDELSQYIGNASITDCVIPFVAVSVDIESAEKIYHTSGLLKDAIRASCSLPLVFKPYELNGRHLVDGGLAESVPIEATRSIGAKRVIGVNIQGFPTEKGNLNVKTLAQRAYRVSVYHLAKKEMEEADKGISFNLEDIESLDLVDKPEELIRMGYDETIKLFR